MTLGDFVKWLVASLIKEKIAVPFQNEYPWHELFYQLKTTGGKEKKPDFLNDLRFDWDASYPKCKQLSEFLHALHWTASVSATNPRFDRITLPDNIADNWQKRGEDEHAENTSFFSAAMDLARKEFQDADSICRVS